MKILSSILAKSDDGTLNSTLVNHTQMVVNLSLYIGSNLFNFEDKDLQTSFLEQVALAAIGHDIGKIDPSFQNIVKKKEFSVDGENVEISIKNTSSYRHHILSFSILNSCSTFNNIKWWPMLKAVLYHHTPNNNDVNVTQYDVINSSLEEKDKEVVRDFYNHFKNYVNYTFDIDIPSFSFDSEIPVYMDKFGLYERLMPWNTVNNSNNKSLVNDMLFHAIRAIIIFADRTVSAGDVNLEKIYNNNADYMRQYLAGINNIPFSISQIKTNESDIDIERFNRQMAIADEIVTKRNVVLKANAGYGKTMVGLLTVLKSGKKALWAVPKKMICDNTYKSIVETMGKIGINLNVCSYYGNEIQQSNNTELTDVSEYDIVVIVIDSLLGRSIKNNLAKLLLDTYTNTVIFDEFHEFFVREGLFSAFLRLVFGRIKTTEGISLFMSATPKSFKNILPSMYEEEYRHISEINPDIIYGDVKINIHYLETISLSDLRKHIKENSFIIASTVKIAQDIYDICKDMPHTLLIHSLFGEDDLETKKLKVYETHGQYSNIELRDTVIVGTSIIGTGLDISAKNIYDFPVSPEETVQRLAGRGSRWGEYDTIDYYICVCNDHTVKRSEKKLIKGAYDATLNNEWVEFLKHFDGQTVTKQEFYRMYEDFKCSYQKKIERYENSLFADSSDALQLLTVRKGSNKKRKDDEIKLGQSLNFRGLSNDVWVVVNNKKLCLDINRLGKESSEDNKRRAKHYAALVDESRLKYQYCLKTSNDYSVDKCCELAREKSLALPLFRATYDSEIGLRFDD